MPATQHTRTVSLGGRQYSVFDRREATFLYEEIYDDLCYLKPGLIHLNRGDTVIDIGANVGFFAIQAAEAVGGHGTVIAVEAAPATCGALRSNLSGHSTPSHAAPVALNRAVTNADSGTAEVTWYPRAAGWGTLDAAAQEKRMAVGLRAFIGSAIEDRNSKERRPDIARATGRGRPVDQAAERLAVCDVCVHLHPVVARRQASAPCAVLLRARHHRGVWSRGGGSAQN